MPVKRNNKIDINQFLETSIHNTIQEWKEENSKGSIKERVIHDLDRRRNEIIAKSLGFNSTYGSRYEVDHCNSRNGNTTVGQFLVEHSQEAVQEWLLKEAKQFDGLVGEVADEVRSAIKLELSRIYQRHLKETIRNIVKAKAEADAHKMINDALENGPEA